MCEGRNNRNPVSRVSIFTCILWIVSVLWIILCLYLSWQSGEETAGLSEEVTKGVEWAIRLFGVDVDAVVLHAFLRKSAHAAIFFVAGVLCNCSFRKSLPRHTRVNGISAVMAIAVCTLLALVAEVGKLWIPGRHLQWDETFLDWIGAVCGAGIVWLIGILQKSKKSGNIDDKNESRIQNRSV